MALLQLRKTLKDVESTGSRGHGHPELMPILLDHALDAQDPEFPCPSAPKSASRSCIGFLRVQAASTTSVHNRMCWGWPRSSFCHSGGMGHRAELGGKKNVGCGQKLASPHVTTFQCETLMNCKFELGLSDHYENTLVKIGE